MISILRTAAAQAASNKINELANQLPKSISVVEVLNLANKLNVPCQKVERKEMVNWYNNIIVSTGKSGYYPKSEIVALSKAMASFNRQFFAQDNETLKLPLNLFNSD